MRTLAQVRYKNFQLLRDVVFNVPQGVVFVGGENEEKVNASSNMSGKSTLLAGIPFALYGCDLSGANIAADCVSFGEKDCNVSVRFMDGDKVLTIERARRGGALGSGQSRNVLSIVTGKVGATKRSKVDVGAAETQQAKVDALFGPKDLFLAAHCFGYVEGAVPFASAGDREQRRLFELLIDSSDLHGASERVMLDVKRCLSKAQLINDALQRCDGETKALETRAVDLAERIKQLEQQTGNDVDLPAVKWARAELDALRKQEEHYHDLIAAQDKARSASRLAASEFGKVHALHMQRLHEKKVLEKEKERLEQGEATKICPTCAQPVMDMNNLHRKIKTLRYQLRALDTKGTREALFAHGRACKAQDAILAKATVARQSCVRPSAKQIEDAERVYTTTKRKYEHALQVMGQLTAMSAEAAKVAKALRECTARQKELSLRGDKVRRKLKDLAFYSETFGPVGIRSYRLDVLTPQLNACAAQFSHVLFGDGTLLRYSTQSKLKTGVTRERFEAFLYKPDATGTLKKVEGSISAGQAMRRDVVHTLAVSKLARLMGKARVSLLIFDEMFRTLDAVGVTRAMDCLNALEQDVNTILVAEHNDDLRSMFSKVVTVRRKAGASIVV